MRVVITAIIGIVVLVAIAALSGHDGYILSAGMASVASLCSAWIAYKKGHREGYQTAKVMLQAPPECEKE